jgi:hypothetical protein
VIADVGQNAWEEVDYEPANRGGRNYGWRNREGAHPYDGTFPPAYTPLTDPIFEYDHSVGDVITGGYVYRGSRMRPFFKGRYFYADEGRGRVWSLGMTINGVTGEATAVDVIEHTNELGGSATLGAITSFGRDSAGELYLVSYTGTVFKIVDVTPPPDETLLFFNDNGDSYKDLFRLNRTTGAWTVQHGNSTGLFDLARSGGWATGWQVSVADFNADGLDDLFLYDPSTGTFFKVINTGSAFSYFSQVWRIGFTTFIVDLNGDGRSDVFLYNAASGVWFSCISTGDGTAGFIYATGTWEAGLSLYPADFDGDGRADFLLLDPVSGVFTKAVTRGSGVFLLNSGGWATGWIPTIARLNGDTLDDVLLYNPTTGIFFRCLSTGDGTVGFSYVNGGWASGWTVRPADFDGNGVTDLFLINSSGDWFKAVNSGAAFSYFNGGWAQWETTVADLNGDSKSDIFLIDRSSGVYFEALTTTPGAFTYTTGQFTQ